MVHLKSKRMRSGCRPLSCSLFSFLVAALCLPVLKIRPKEVQICSLPGFLVLKLYEQTQNHEFTKFLIHFWAFSAHLVVGSLCYFQHACCCSKLRHVAFLFPRSFRFYLDLIETVTPSRHLLFHDKVRINKGDCQLYWIFSVNSNAQIYSFI